MNSVTLAAGTAATSAENTRFIILISVVAAIGGFLFGYDSGVINGTVDGLKRTFDSDAAVTGFNVASILLGCAAGAFLAGNLADKFGRRTVMIATALMFTVGAWGSGISHSSAEFVVYRLLAGLAIGAASVICPAYISEIAPAGIRGRLASLQQLAIVLGLFMAFLSNYLIANACGGASNPFWLGFQGWQWMFWAGMIPALVFLLSLLLIPESPRYLVAAQRIDKARAVLARLDHAADADVKVREIEQTLKADHKPSMADLIDKAAGKVRPIVWVAIGLAVFQQLVGINVVFYYGEVLWSAAGFTPSDALLINVIGGAVNVASTFVAIALIDKLGRKPLLLAGSIGMAITLGGLAWIFGTSPMEGGKLMLSNTTGTTALLLANVYVFCFGTSWGPVMWVMLGEMFPNRIRGSGLAVAGLFQWLANFSITWTFPMLLAGIGLAGAYGIYAASAAISVFFVWRYVYETRGKELEEMAG
jgi:SP family sugar:H+ symporter-like MFS transporter